MRHCLAWSCAAVLAASACGSASDRELFTSGGVRNDSAGGEPSPSARPAATLPAPNATPGAPVSGGVAPAGGESGRDESAGSEVPSIAEASSGGQDAGAVVDAVGADTTAPCSPASFGAPELVAGLPSPAGLNLWAPSLSADGLTLHFGADQPGVNEHVFVATRGSRDAAFSAPTLVNGVNSDASEGTPFSSTDGLTLYFYSSREGGQGDRDLWVSTRVAPDAAFTEPVSLAELGSAAADHLPWVSPNELSMLFSSARRGVAGDVWLAQRAAKTGAFGSPVPLEEINTDANEGRAVLSSDGLTIIFASDREGGQGTQDLWMATRDASGAPFAAAVNLIAQNSPALDQDPFLSADGTELLFASSRGGPSALYRAIRTCD